MDYRTLKAKLEEARGLARAVVADAEAAPDLATVVAKHGAVLPFTKRVWDVFHGNVLKLRGVQRIDKHPYATHPTRMALLCLWGLAGEAGAEDAAVLALLHDYLEEGDGMTPDAVAAMRRRFPAEPDAAIAAVVLSEPFIDYLSLGPESETAQWRRVAYVAQAVDALETGLPASFADAALADKLDNLHDLGYLEQRPAGAKRAVSLAQRVAFFTLVEQELGPRATPAMRRLLADGLAARIEELQIAREVEAELADLRDRLEGQRSVLRRLIRRYHGEIKLEL